MRNCWGLKNTFCTFSAECFCLSDNILWKHVFNVRCLYKQQQWLEIFGSEVCSSLKQLLKTKPWRNFIAYTKICARYGNEILELAFLSAYQVFSKWRKRRGSIEKSITDNWQVDWVRKNCGNLRIYAFWVLTGFWDCRLWSYANRLVSLRWDF